jgi:peptide/nickel transport system substrate-binding protein
MTDGYWTGRRRRALGRRAVLRGGLTGAAGLAAAFALACGGDGKKEGAAGAGGSPSAAQGAATPNPELANAKRGGTFNFDQADEPISFDQHRQEPPGSVHIANLVYNHLLRRWEDFEKQPGVVNVEGELAQAWEQVDKTTYKFTLVRTATWHKAEPLGGRPLRASDVKYSFERMKGSDPELRTRSAFEPVEKIETPDDHTVVVTTREPFAGFISNVGHTWSVIMAPELGETPDVNRKGVGTGPFVFREWQRGVAVIFDRNPDYWRRGQPFFDRVILRIVSDRAARAANFRSGETNTWGGAPPDVPYETIDEMKRAVGDVREIRAEGTNNSGTKAYFNVTAPPFNDKRVRQAFLYGVDYASLIKIFGGLAQRGAPMPLASIWGLSLDDLPKTDIARAKQLLEAAGYSDSRPLRVTTSFSQQYSGPSVSQVLQQLMKPVGVDIQLNQMENAAWIAKVYRGGQDYQMSSHADWSWEDPDRGLYSYFHSRGAANNTHFANAQVDSLLEKQRGEFDLEARKKIVREIQLLLIDEAPDVWLVAPGGITLVRNRLKNYKHMVGGNSNLYRQWEFCWFDPVPN